MRKLPIRIRRWSRAAALLATVGTAAAAAGCDDFLKVTNPGAVEPPALENPAYIPLMVNGVIGDFQPAFAWTAFFSGVFTDELRNHFSFGQNVQIDQRNVDDTNGTYTLAVYNGLHRTRFLADSVATRLRVLHGDSASRNLGLATVLTYGGYAWTLLGEQYCETPIQRSEPVPSEKLLETAVQRFDEAIRVASAARAAPPSFSTPAARVGYVAQADSIANLARVGAARAALNLSAYNPAAKARALGYAKQVTPAYASAAAPGFRFFARYDREGTRYTRRISNPFWEFITAGASWVSLGDTPFENLNDPRVPQTTNPVVVSGGSREFVPNSPISFSTYSGTINGAPFDASSDIQLGSALEARYVIAELEGVNAANLAFVNQRRAVGGQTALPATTTAAQFMAALREQRGRDLYLTAHRLGDLRRYAKMYNVNLFPSGPYPGSSTARYGTQECWPIPLTEKF